MTRNQLPIAEKRAAPEARSGNLSQVREALRHLPHEAAFAEDLDTVNQLYAIEETTWGSLSTRRR